MVLVVRVKMLSFYGRRRQVRYIRSVITERKMLARQKAAELGNLLS